MAPIKINTDKKNRLKLIAEPGKQDIFILREFEAPRALVFKAHVDAKLYPQWIGPQEFIGITLEKFEPRAGGEWRYIVEDQERNKFAFHGVYHEVTPPERIVNTFEYEGWSQKGHIELDTTKFEELPKRRTLVKVHAVYQSVADRDAMIAAGMEKGLGESYDQLDNILIKLSKKK